MSTGYKYKLPLNLLTDFQTRWGMTKALWEFRNFAKEHNILPEMVQSGELDAACSLIARLLGEDVAHSLVALLKAATATMKAEAADQEPEGASIESSVSKARSPGRRVN